MPSLLPGIGPCELPSYDREVCVVPCCHRDGWPSSRLYRWIALNIDATVGCSLADFAGATRGWTSMHGRHDPDTESCPNGSGVGTCWASTGAPAGRVRAGRPMGRWNGQLRALGRRTMPNRRDRDVDESDSHSQSLAQRAAGWSVHLRWAPTSDVRKAWPEAVSRVPIADAARPCRDGRCWPASRGSLRTCSRNSVAVSRFPGRPRGLSFSLRPNGLTRGGEPNVCSARDGRRRGPARRSGEALR
jgi:hypothetical protein